MGYNARILRRHSTHHCRGRRYSATRCRARRRTGRGRRCSRRRRGCGIIEETHVRRRRLSRRLGNRWTRRRGRCPSRLRLRHLRLVHPPRPRIVVQGCLGLATPAAHRMPTEPCGHSHSRASRIRLPGRLVQSFLRLGLRRAPPGIGILQHGCAQLTRVRIELVRLLVQRCWAFTMRRRGSRGTTVHGPTHTFLLHRFWRITRAHRLRRHRLRCLEKSQCMIHILARGRRCKGLPSLQGPIAHLDKASDNVGWRG